MDLPFLRLEESAIDASDKTFRVRTRHAPLLRESIRRRGIRTPLLVERRGARHCIVSGWGRWEARPEGAPVPCFVLPEGLPAEEAWNLFLEDNDAWNVLEIARIIRGLGAVPGLDEDRVVAEKLPLLGLHASRDLHRRHLRLLELSPEAQRFIEDEGLPLRRAMLLFKLSEEALDPFLACARELRLTLNEVGEALEMLEEVSHREGVGARRVLEEVLAASAGGGKERFRSALRERRYPELSRHRGRLEALERELRFTVPVRIEWDPFLERPGIRLAADLADEAAAETFARELEANRSVIRRLFEVV